MLGWVFVIMQLIEKLPCPKLHMVQILAKIYEIEIYFIELAL